MKTLSLALLVALSSTPLSADDWDNNPAFEGEVIDSYASEYNPVEQTYRATTESGKRITGTHSDLGGIEVQQWTTTDPDGSRNTTRCESYGGSTFCH